MNEIRSEIDSGLEDPEVELLEFLQMKKELLIQVRRHGSCHSK